MPTAVRIVTSLLLSQGAAAAVSPDSAGTRKRAAAAAAGDGRRVREGGVPAAQGCQDDARAVERVRAGVAAVPEHAARHSRSARGQRRYP